MNNCIFCQIVKGESPSWKVYENEDVYAFLDINPVSRYHTLVIPKRHYETIFDIEENDLKAVIAAVKLISNIFQEKLGINNIQIINSNGIEAQQDVFHIHYHIVPRKFEDGQNIKWRIHPQWRSDFDDMIKNLITD